MKGKLDRSLGPDGFFGIPSFNLHVNAVNQRDSRKMGKAVNLLRTHVTEVVSFVV